MKAKKLIPLALGFSILSSTGFSPLDSIFNQESSIPAHASTIKKENYSGIVTASSLNVRSRGDLKARVIGRVKKNSKITVIGSISGWLEIKYGKSNGWVSSKYIKRVTTPSSTSALKTIYKVRVIKDQSAIHTSNSGSAKVIGHIKINSILEVVKVNGSWYEVKNGKGYAWIYSPYVSKNLTVPKPTPKPTPTKPTSNGVSGAPSASSGYTLASGSYVRSIDVAKANNVKVTNTWSSSTKNAEIQAIAKATGLHYSSSGSQFSLDFVDLNMKEVSVQFDVVTIVSDFTTRQGKPIMTLQFDNTRQIRLPEGEYILKVLLKPYFPKSYSQIADKFIKDSYYTGGNYMENPVFYDGRQLQMIGGILRIWK